MESIGLGDLAEKLLDPAYPCFSKFDQSCAFDTNMELMRDDLIWNRHDIREAMLWRRWESNLVKPYDHDELENSAFRQWVMMYIFQNELNNSGNVVSVGDSYSSLSLRWFMNLLKSEIQMHLLNADRLRNYQKQIGRTENRVLPHKISRYVDEMQESIAYSRTADSLLLE